MEKIPILMREPRMWDYNKMAYAINNIIDIDDITCIIDFLNIEKEEF